MNSWRYKNVCSIFSDLAGELVLSTTEKNNIIGSLRQLKKE